MKIEEIRKIVKASDEALLKLEELFENGHEIEKRKIKGFVSNRWCIKLICTKCKEEYWKTLYEFNKNVNKKQGNFCSISCSMGHAAEINRSEAEKCLRFI